MTSHAHDLFECRITAGAVVAFIDGSSMDLKTGLVVAVDLEDELVTICYAKITKGALEEVTIKRTFKGVVVNQEPPQNVSYLTPKKPPVIMLRVDETRETPAELSRMVSQIMSDMFQKHRDKPK